MSSKVVNVLSNNIVALCGQLTVVLHQAFRFRDQAKGVVSKLQREIGNVSNNSDVTFGFQVEESQVEAFKKAFEAKKFEDPKLELISNVGVPIQMQLQYKTNDGGIYLRVITAYPKLSFDRNDVEKDINSSVVAVEAVQNAARLAQAGAYFDARICLVTTQRLLQRTMKTPKHQKDYLNFIVQAEKLDGFMREAQLQEKIIGGVSGPTGNVPKKDDEAAKSIFQMKSLALQNFMNRT